MLVCSIYVNIRNLLGVASALYLGPDAILVAAFDGEDRRLQPGDDIFLADVWKNTVSSDGPR